MLIPDQPIFELEKAPYDSFIRLFLEKRDSDTVYIPLTELGQLRDKNLKEVIDRLIKMLQKFRANSPILTLKLINPALEDQTRLANFPAANRSRDEVGTNWYEENSENFWKISVTIFLTLVRSIDTIRKIELKHVNFGKIAVKC